MKSLYIIPLFLFSINAMAQKAKDTTPTTQVIKVKSTFKPVLRNTNKESFYATPPSIDSSKPTLNYNVPSQNLFFSYQPVPLKPVAMNIVNTTIWENNNYIKVGFGNLRTPYASAGFSFGDGTSTSLGIFADYINSNGKIKYQDYSKIGLSAQGSKTTPTGFEFKSKLSYQLDDYNNYGYDASIYNFAKKDIDQKLQTIAFSAGFRNTIPTEFGLNYNPTLSAAIFSDNKKGSETNLVITAPLVKNIGKNLSFKLGLSADFTFHKTPILSTSNNIFYVMPAVQYKTAKLSINGGVTPAWDNGKLNILPDVTADFQIKQGKKYVAQLGWLGYYNKGTYQRWAGINPYISQPRALFNTKVNEIFAGFKGTSGSHIVYAVKAAYVGYNSMPLFLNDTGSGKNYTVIKESQLDAVQLHTEVGVIEKEVFHLTAGFNFNSFINLKDNAKAWGLLPLEATASLRWQLFKDFWLKSDAFIWEGALFKTPSNLQVRMPFVLDLNAGVEFKVAKQLNVWFQANNLIDNQYQRWRNYEVYGLNILGGVKYTFANKKASLFNVKK